MTLCRYVVRCLRGACLADKVQIVPGTKTKEDTMKKTRSDTRNQVIALAAEGLDRSSQRELGRQDPWEVLSLGACLRVCDLTGSGATAAWKTIRFFGDAEKARAVHSAGIGILGRHLTKSERAVTSKSDRDILISVHDNEKRYPGVCGSARLHVYKSHVADLQDAIDDLPVRDCRSIYDGFELGIHLTSSHKCHNPGHRILRDMLEVTYAPAGIDADAILSVLAGGFSEYTLVYSRAVDILSMVSAILDRDSDQFTKISDIVVEGHGTHPGWIRPSEDASRHVLQRRLGISDVLSIPIMPEEVNYRGNLHFPIAAAALQREMKERGLQNLEVWTAVAAIMQPENTLRDALEVASAI